MILAYCLAVSLTINILAVLHWWKTQKDIKVDQELHRLIQEFEMERDMMLEIRTIPKDSFFLKRVH